MVSQNMDDKAMFLFFQENSAAWQRFSVANFAAVGYEEVI